MNDDLLLATSGIIAISVVAVWLGGRISKKWGSASILIAAFSSLLAVLFVFYMKDHIWWCAIIPHSAAIIWCNLAPVFLGLAVGAAYQLPGRPLWRRLLASGLLACLAIFSLLQPVLQPVLRPVQGADDWVNGVCMQSQWATCSAAASATLLAQHNIDTTEAEQVELCLTDAAGTPSLGLYRGLKLSIDPQRQDVVPLLIDVDELLQREPFPAIVFVGLPPDGDYPRYYVEEKGWIPGVRHSVVVFGKTEAGYYAIGDPSAGREDWTAAEMQLLYRGEGLRILDSQR